MSFFDSLRSGLSSMVSPFRSVIGSLAPVAGTLLGGYFGGPGGAGIGSGLGSAIGRWIGGGDTQQPQQAVENTVNRMMPEGMQGMTFGQMGNRLQDQTGNFLNSAISHFSPQVGALGLGNTAANAAGNWLSNRYGSSLPQGFSGMNPGQAAGNAFNYGMSQMMPSYGAQRPQMAFGAPSGMGMAVNGRPMGAATYNDGGYVNSMPGNMMVGGAY